MRIAMDLGKTRAELLNGGPQPPLSSDEYILWLAWYELENEDAKAAEEKAKAKAKAGN